MRHAMAVAVTVWLIVASVATATACAGWQPTPSARRACCASSGHDCRGQVSADACCGQTEQSHQPSAACAVIGIAAPSRAVALPIALLPDSRWASQHVAAVIFERTIQKRPHSPPSFLTSVLLI